MGAWNLEMTNNNCSLYGLINNVALGDRCAPSFWFLMNQSFKFVRIQELVCEQQDYYIGQITSPLFLVSWMKQLTLQSTPQKGTDRSKLRTDGSQQDWPFECHLKNSQLFSNHFSRFDLYMEKYESESIYSKAWKQKEKVLARSGT